MFKFVNIGEDICGECGKHSDGIFQLEICSSNSVYSGFLKLCPECRSKMVKVLSCITDKPNDVPAEPHGGKWFTIWKEDKESILETMHRNLSADLEAGYSRVSKCIKDQLDAIDEYKAQYFKELDKFVLMSDKEVSRYCYYDLKKRGAIL